MASRRPKYNIPNEEAYRRFQASRIDRAERCRLDASEGKNLNHWNLSSWQESALELAGCALAFGEGDNVVSQHFADALTASRAWLAAGKPWQPKPRAVDSKVTLIDHGDVVFEVTERMPRMADIGWMQDWNIGTFDAALLMFLAFGSPDDAGRSAHLPEVAYRSPDVLGDATAYANVRAQKAWILRQFSEARKACQESLEALPPQLPRKVAKALMIGRDLQQARSRALLAMMDGQSDHLSTAMAELETAHKRFYAVTPGTALRFFSLPGLALARMAKTHDLTVEETPTIPTRFLPGPLVPR